VKAGQGGLESFAGRIDAIVNAAPGALSDAADAIRTALGDCRQAVGHIRDHPDEAPYHGRRLLDLMTDTLSAALLLEEAAADITVSDARKAIVARRFSAHRWAARRGLAPIDDPAQRHFDAIIRCESVPIENKG
jgi:hypothetical protein